MGPMRWVYGAYTTFSWPAAKSTVIMVELVMEPRCDGVVSVTLSSNPDVSVHVGSAKVTVVMVTSLVTWM